MKKSTFLKLALVFGAMLMFADLYAQPAAINTNYVQVGANTTFQTEGKTFRLYVAPDVVYSPDYDGTDPADLNDNARWTWTYAYPAALEGTPATGVLSAAETNWVTFTTVVSGTYTVSVIESNTVTGCADADAVSQTVEVVDAPTAIIAGTTDAAGYTWSGTNPYTDCLPAVPTTETVTITITEDTRIPAAFRTYALLINETVENLEADLTTPIAPALADNDFSYTVATKLNPAHATLTANPTHTWTPNDVGTATSTYTLPTATLTVQGGLPTRYTYTISTATDVVAGTGIVSAISHKSDYDWTDGVYDAVPSAFGATTSVAYIVLPAPVTGPIYHIPSDFND